MCLKYPPLAHMHVLSGAHRWSMHDQFVLFTAMPNVYAPNWKEWGNATHKISQ